MTPARRNLTLHFFGAVQFVGLCGDRLKQFSLVSMLGLLAPGSSVEMLKLTLCSQVPILLFTPIAGWLIDRWSKPATIIGACLLRALLLLAVPLAYDHSGTIHAFFAAAFVLSILDLMFAPARSALLPELASADRLLRTNAVFWTLGIAGTLFGFVGGGWLFDYFSWRMTFYSNAVVYVIAAVFMVPVLLAHRAPAAAPPTLLPVRAEFAILTRSVRDAFDLLRQSRALRASLVAQVGVFAVGGAMSVIAIARVQEIAPPGQARFLAEIGAALIVGLVTGSFLAGWSRDRAIPERTVSVGTLTAGVAIAGMGRAESLLPMCIWAGLLGASLSPIFVVTETLMQHESPRRFTGRVFAAREALIKAAYIIAAIVATAVNAFVSKSAILVGLGLFLALLGVILERTGWLRMERP